MESEGKNTAWTWILLALVILVLIAGVYFYLTKIRQNTSSTQTQSTNAEKSWQEGRVVIEGKFADAEVVPIGTGKYRMYYSEEPEVVGFNGKIFSATSSDGISWTQETGIRKEMATFADVIQLPNGTWRLYFQNAGVIKSATSSDGLTWKDETGTRIDTNEPGFSLENVGAQSTTLLDDGTYIMVYRGTINEPYQTTEKLPNQTTQLYFYATSKDGLTFDKKGLAIDSRDENLLGLTDGGEWVKWDSVPDSEQVELRVYFWSYSGVYHTTYKDGKFSSPVFDYTNNKDKTRKFPSNPPGDPTLAKINDIWFMYYGQHEKGIYYAEYK